MRSFPEYRRVASFADTDMAGVVHFTNILKYVEEAEHAGFRILGFEVLSSEFGFPRVKVGCDYLKPVRFGDDLVVQLSVVEVGERKVSWEFEVLAGEHLAAKGQMVTVCVSRAGKAQKMPAEYMRALAAMI
ncbi:acyl-CoA thioesterase [Rubritalea marina]|uniref:acyl-CoA thioesterase n=1 Tax=Rubritalea marina TaxID=361055 RepID=UPI000524509B|nr:thioesterase family protein [Rubritalea marina]